MSHVIVIQLLPSGCDAPSCIVSSCRRVIEYGGLWVGIDGTDWHENYVLQTKHGELAMFGPPEWSSGPAVSGQWSVVSGQWSVVQ